MLSYVFCKQCAIIKLDTRNFKFSDEHSLRLMYDDVGVPFGGHPVATCVIARRCKGRRFKLNISYTIHTHYFNLFL